MPNEPEAFCEQVLQMLLRWRPEVRVEQAGPSEAVIDGRRVDLENLRRLALQAGDRGDEIVREYLEQLLGGEAREAELLPFELARRLIMPRIHHETIFERLDAEQVAHTPYVNDTVVVFVIDLPHCTVSVSVDQIVRWRTDMDELERLARENLRACSRDLEMKSVSAETGGSAIVFSERDGYDAARLLLTDLYEQLAPELGGDFLVAAPARDRFVAVSREPETLIQQVQGRVDREYRRLPYPITTRFFYVTRDGVAGTEAA
ncbi:MAG: DUF1444 family protein [Planctomycetota bacterium]|nr:MAG: DUF1444 family protein [Planctomycetota bacterium]